MKWASLANKSVAKLMIAVAVCLLLVILMLFPIQCSPRSRIRSYAIFVRDDDRRIHIVTMTTKSWYEMFAGRYLWHFVSGISVSPRHIVDDKTVEFVTFDGELTSVSVPLPHDLDWIGPESQERDGSVSVLTPSCGMNWDGARVNELSPSLVEQRLRDSEINDVAEGWRRVNSYDPDFPGDAGKAMEVRNDEWKILLLFEDDSSAQPADGAAKLVYHHLSFRIYFCESTHHE